MELDLNPLMKKLGEQARFTRVLRAADNVLTTLVALGLFSERTNHSIHAHHLGQFMKRHYVDEKAKSR